MTSYPDSADAKRAITADTRINPAFLQQTEDQIAAIGGHVVGDKGRPFSCCYPKADPGAAALPAGVAVAVRATNGPGDEPLMVLATSANLAAGAVLLGILTEATNPGARGRVAVAGVVPSSLCVGITGGGGFVLADNTTGVLIRTSTTPTNGTKNYVGRSTNDNAVVLAPAGFVVDAAGGGGGGNTTTIGGFGTRPAASTAGNTFIDETSDVVSIDTGSAWKPIIAGTTLGVEPPTASWSWVNQSTGNVFSNAKQTIVASSVAGHLISRVRTIVSTNFDLTAHFRLQTYPTGNVGGGLVVHETSSGKSISCILRRNSSNSRWEICVAHWTNGTTWLSDQVALDIELASHGIWFGCYKNGLTRTFTYSVDGSGWTTIHSVGDGSFLTPSHYGFGAVPDGGEVRIACDSFEAISVS